MNRRTRPGRALPKASRGAAALAAATWLFLAQAGPAHAGDDDRLGVGLRSIVSGNEQNAVTIRPQETVKSLTLVLTREGAPAIKISAQNVAAGGQRDFEVKQPEGTFVYEAQFAVVWDDGSSSSFKSTFKLTRVGKLKLEVSPADVDLDARQMSFKMSNPAAKAELTIMGQNGQPLSVVAKDLAGAAPGTALSLGWDAPKGDVLFMDLKVTDVAGFWTGVRLTPFAIEIPHDDVVFESGKWDIRASEEPKLTSTMGQIKEALAKHGTLLQLKLYVAGCTDTVGGKDANQTLSDNRARAIAGWFRKSGLKIPVFFQGFGEDVLAKKTPDETAEAANRRAVYILSSQRPATSSALPRDAWKPL